MRWTSVRTITAGPERAFRVVADPEECHKAIPDGLSVTYLTVTRSGVGTKFRATRLVKGKSTAFDQEVTEFVPRERVRMINVTHGTLWDASFSVRRVSSKTLLTLTTDAKTDRLPVKLINRLITCMVQRALDRDMDAVQLYCEQ